METKTFRVVTSISLAFTVIVAVLSIVSIAIDGIYPGMFVLCGLTLIPLASKIYAKRNRIKAVELQSNYYTLLTIINLLCILVVLWMTFVIVHDRVLGDC